MTVVMGPVEARKVTKFRWLLAAWVILLIVGIPAAILVQEHANSHDACPAPPKTADASSNVSVTALPTAISAAYSYGRGTRVLTLPVTASVKHGKLPAAIDIATVVPTDGDGVALHDMTASVKQIDGTASYNLEVCITAPHAAAGTYSGRLFFPGANVPKGTAIPVAATFQSRSVPWVLFVGGPILMFLGVLYATALVERRAVPTISLRDLWRESLEQIQSVNGVIALVAATGAVFTAWDAQCFRNATWGAPWPALFVTCVTLAGAAAGAATIPMGLSSEPARQTQVNLKP